VAASKPTGQNTKPKDDVPASFDKINRHASEVVGKSKKMLWIPKGGTRTSTVRPTLISESHMTSKVLMFKYTNKKADP
jgi:hypothetical protein